MTYYEIQNTYFSIAQNLGGVLYEPISKTPFRHIGIVLMHSDSDYYGFVPAPALAKRGFTVLASKVQTSCEPLDQKLLDLKKVVDFLKAMPQIDKIILLGHSGGATLMTAYQCVAENGEAIFQDDKKIIKLSHVGSLTRADGMMLLDSNWGNGVMTLVSLEPGITRDDSSRGLTPGYDLSSPENGYRPEGAEYTDAFIQHYLKGQEQRNARLIDTALTRLKKIEAGEGAFEDDEPFPIAGGSQIGPNNRLFPQDIRLLSHTRREWPLIHKDGSVTVEIVRSLRKPRPAVNLVRNNGCSTNMSTVRTYLTNAAVRTKDFYYDDTGIYGIEWDSCYCCTPGNITGVTVPLLLMGMTGSYECLAAELIYERSASRDKTLAFVEGASHMFETEHSVEAYPGQYGDTVKTCFDYAANWLMRSSF